MSDKYFIDTNIFVYCFDDRQPPKKDRALAIIANALQSNEGMISWQVVQEFLNVCTRKFSIPLKPGDARAYLDKVLRPLCTIFPDPDLYSTALELVEKTGYSFYDSLILAGAQRGGCKILYTEDLHSGHQIEGITIINPFV